MPRLRHWILAKDTWSLLPVAGSECFDKKIAGIHGFGGTGRT
jgi:hypothetical protein